MSLIYTSKNTNITSIQMTLDECVGKKLSFNELLNKRLCDPYQLKKSTELAMPDINHFEYIGRVCPICYHDSLIKKKFVSRKLILIKIGEVMVFLRQYYCKYCGKYHTVKLDYLVRRNCNFTIGVEDNIYEKSKTGRKSLRKVSRDYSVDDIPISHQSVALKLNNNIYDNQLVFVDKDSSSGYYFFDSQHLSLSLKKHYKFQLLDMVTNKTIAIRIFDSENSDNLKKFLQDNISENNMKVICTDHLKLYQKPIAELGFIHQLCIKHFYDILNKLVRDYLKENDCDEDEKETISYFSGRIKSFFKVDNFKSFIDRVDHFIDRWSEIPTFLQDFFDKKILGELDLLTPFLFDSKIIKTTNHLESKFNSAQSGHLKKAFRTVKGVLNYLKPITIDQNERLAH